MGIGECEWVGDHRIGSAHWHTTFPGTLGTGRLRVKGPETASIDLEERQTSSSLIKQPRWRASFRPAECHCAVPRTVSGDDDDAQQQDWRRSDGLQGCRVPTAMPKSASSSHLASCPLWASACQPPPNFMPTLPNFHLFSRRQLGRPGQVGADS